MRIFFLVNIFISIITPIAIEFFTPDKTSKTEEIIIGFCVFIILMTAKILYYMEKINKREMKEEDIWHTKNRFELVLKSLRDNFSLIIHDRHGDHDRLFEDLIMEEINRLEKEVSNAAFRKEVSVKGHHFKSHDKLKEIFKNSKVNIYREVFVVDPLPQDKVFDYIYANFFKMIAKLVDKKEIRVRTIFVLKDNHVINNTNIQNLICFYHNTKGFEKKSIGIQHFDDLRNEYKVNSDWIDFGIYGDQVIFKTHKYGDIIDGVFSKNKEYILRFIEFFDKAWEDSNVLEPTQKQEKSTSLTELFKNFH